MLGKSSIPLQMEHAFATDKSSDSALINLLIMVNLLSGRPFFSFVSSPNLKNKLDTHIWVSRKRRNESKCYPRVLELGESIH